MDEQTEGIRYSRGFNHGYFIARYAPKLMEKINEIKSENSPYIRGIQIAAIAYEREVYMENLEKTRAAQKQDHKPKMR